MRDLANKMAELKFEAPLAQFEETDEWGPIDYQSSTNPNANQTNLKELSLNLKENDNILILGDLLSANHNTDDDLHESFGIGNCGETTKNDSPNCNTNAKNAIILATNGVGGKGDNTEINFTETFSASLEDLVNTFDDKITKCFGNYEESVEELAPVQVRTQEEIMNECQMWWTITGNFGNILPIDWSKSHSRQLHMPTLNLGRRPAQTPDDDINDLSSEDEAVANDLDMHTLILGGLHSENEPIKTAEEVIKEIDDIMDETTPDDDVIISEVMEKAKEVLGAPLYEDKLRVLTIGQLNELYMEMEVLIREFSETLISELALRDEFEYEKELKNTFISLLLAVQNRRRQYHVEKKRGKQKGGSKQPSGMDPKYLTTVIPYSLDSGPPDNQTLQILIKILKAINEDNPTVPTLLTDYILKVLCPT